MFMAKCFVSVLVALVLSLVVAQESYYCANVGVMVGGSVPATTQGYFSMKVGQGYAKYAFDVDLSTNDLCDFNTYPTVSYHIHTFSLTNPTANPVNSCANTEGHYDPTLACSSKSQEAAGSCTYLGRTSTDGYTYACTAPAAGLTEYTTPKGECELGDLSGKLGKVTVSAEGTVASTQVYTDFEPVYNYNFNQATTAITSGWASIVFHCGDATGTRIACGDFELTAATEDSACDFSGDAWVNNESCPSSDDDDDGETLTKPEFAGLLAVLAVGWAVAIALCAWTFLCAGRGSGESAPMMGSRA